MCKVIIMNLDLISSTRITINAIGKGHKIIILRSHVAIA